MVTTDTETLKRVSEELEQISQKKATGALNISNGGAIGTFYFLSGRLMYYVDVLHPVRRWQRVLKQYAADWVVEVEKLSGDQPWQYQLLLEGIAKKHISLIQVKKIIHTVTLEGLFELQGHTKLKFGWKDQEKSESAISLVLTIPFSEIKQDITKANQMWEEWKGAGLAVLKPTLAPFLKTGVEPSTVPDLGSDLNGKLTLWDLAVEEGKSLSQVTRVLIPFIRKSIVKFRQIPDLPAPGGQKTVTAKPSAKTSTPSSTSATPTSEETGKPSTPSGEKKGKALIACIDDSPVVAHNLKKILVPAGYEMLTIDEPMHGFAQLIENQPDLILLDINMPNANGYSVCQFLRNSPVFEKTPIIILTGQDTSVDRARAKLVGATDFLSKPAQEDELLQLVHQYL